MKKRNNSKKDSIRIMSSMIGELSELGDQERKIHRAQKKLAIKLQKIIDVCDDGIKKDLAEDEEVSRLLQQARDAVSQLQILWRRRR